MPRNPKKSSSPPGLTELQTQIRIVKNAKNMFPKECELLHSVPNGSHTGTMWGRLHQLSGLTSGVPDLFLPYASGQYHGLYIEVKKNKSSPVTENQKVFMKKVERVGYQASVARGVEEGLDIIHQYIRGTPCSRT